MKKSLFVLTCFCILIACKKTTTSHGDDEIPDVVTFTIEDAKSYLSSNLNMKSTKLLAVNTDAQHNIVNDIGLFWRRQKLKN